MRATPKFNPFVAHLVVCWTTSGIESVTATQTTDDRRVAVSLRNCDPATPIDSPRRGRSSHTLEDDTSHIMPEQR